MKKLPILLIIFLINIKALAQCNSCDVSIEGNNPPDRAIQNGHTICIEGTRTTPINFNNRNNIKICIADNASWNGQATSLSGLSQLDNFGTLHVQQDFNGSWTLNNFSELSFSINLNSNKSLYNYGSLNIPGDFNSGSQSTFYSNGQLYIQGNVNFNSNSNVNLEGRTIITGNTTINSNSSVQFAGSLQVQGNLQLNSNALLKSLNGDACTELNVNGNFQNNGTIDGSFLGDNGIPLAVNKIPNGNAITGSFAVGGCPDKECVQMHTLDTSNGMDVLYIYTCSDEFIIPSLGQYEEIIDVKVAMIAGGGGGGSGDAAGGGGAGELVERDGITLFTDRIYPVTVGNGGSASHRTSERGNQGTTSSFFGIQAVGGGGGGSTSNNARNGGMGGSGGGAGANNGSGPGQGNRGIGIGAIGNNGGNGNRGGNGNQLTGGGGGGAGQPGANGSNNHPGNGGAGRQKTILIGTNVIPNAFGGGGGSTGVNPAQGYGESTGGAFAGIKLGGDGDGRQNQGLGRFGRANTGSGGGAGNLRGGAGSSGIVIIRVVYRILPLMDLKLQVDKSETNSNLLSWNVQSQRLLGNYVIERAIEDIDNWEEIAEIIVYNDMGDYTHTFEDTQIPKGKHLIYYRIKYTTSEGLNDFSKVVSILSTNAIQSSQAFQVSPNPVIGREFKIEKVDFGMQDELSVEIISMDGYSYSAKGSNIDEISEMALEFFKSNRAGIYVVAIRWGNQVEFHKVINSK